MSPDITPVVRPQSVARILTDAVNAALAAGLTVSTASDLGVVCVSTASPKWEPAAFSASVSVLGAVLLARQPPVADPDDALSSVFGSRFTFHEGIEDGAAGAAPAHPGQLYADGYVLGVEMRALLHRRQGVPVARPDDAPTNPVQIDTPRSVIAEVLECLTDSQELETLADRCAARVPKLPPRLAEDLRVVEFTLRAIAAELRGAS